MGGRYVIKKIKNRTVDEERVVDSFSFENLLRAPALLSAADEADFIVIEQRDFFDHPVGNRYKLRVMKEY